MEHTCSEPHYFTSIVILTHNKLNHTQACIESIRKYTAKVQYEIIVVDNNSTDGTKDWLGLQKDIRCIFNDENKGFPTGCNQGIEISNGHNILLLNNDTIVTENWLSYLLTCLYSSSDIGAVGPVTNHCSYYQAIPTSYQSMDEMQAFAKEHNRPDPAQWENRIKLVGFCMLIKKCLIDSIGLLDERFSPGNFEDDDYSFRILQAGCKLVLCKNVFIHHFGSTSFNENPQHYQALLQQNEKKFVEKWGFTSSYSSFIRHEIIKLMDTHASSAPLRVLEIGCACGATLLQIKNQYRQAQLFGIELNEHASAISGTFADVRAMDAERDLDYPEGYFDYIILADVLEHLYDPWRVVANLKKYLNISGKLLVSIPNTMHYSLLRNVIRGHWTYTDAGLLDRTHVRFFTLNELDKMFQDAGYSKQEYSANVLPISSDDMVWVNRLWEMSGLANADQFKAYQYLVRVHY